MYSCCLSPLGSLLFCCFVKKYVSIKFDRTTDLKELLGLLQLQRCMLGRLLVGGLRLAGDEAVVGDDEGRGEDGGGDQHGVTVDLLHGEGLAHQLLLHRVPGGQRSG